MKSQFIFPTAVREIAFEVGLLGQTGLDYASSDKKYTLRTPSPENRSRGWR